MLIENPESLSRILESRIHTPNPADIEFRATTPTCQNVARMVLREVAVLVAIGISMALPATWAASRSIASQLYAVTPMDPATIVLATMCLITVAAAAGLIPALRAARVNPLTALRHE